MTARTGLFVARDGSGNGTDPVGARLALGSLLARPGSTPLDVREGVLYDGGGNVLSGNTDTGTMSYSVRAAGFVQCTSPSNGAVVAVNDGTLKVPTTAAPATDKRIDSVWYRQHLVAGDGGTDPDVVLEIGCTQGATSASPTPPTIPVDAVEIGQAVMTAGTTSTSSLTISQTHKWTAPLGTPIPVRNAAERNALGGYEGLRALRLDTGNVDVYTGGAWDDGGWKPFTPQVVGAGWSLGNATTDCAYKRIGKTVHVRYKITWGTSSTYGSARLDLNLPSNAASGYYRFPGFFTKNGGGRYTISGLCFAGASAGVVALHTESGGAFASITSTNPVAPAANDVLFFQGTYDEA